MQSRKYLIYAVVPGARSVCKIAPKTTRFAYIGETGARVAWWVRVALHTSKKTTTTVKALPCILISVCDGYYMENCILQKAVTTIFVLNFKIFIKFEFFKGNF